MKFSNERLVEMERILHRENVQVFGHSQKQNVSDNLQIARARERERERQRQGETEI